MEVQKVPSGAGLLTLSQKVLSEVLSSALALALPSQEWDVIEAVVPLMRRVNFVSKIKRALPPTESDYWSFPRNRV
eukprot:NODE_6220_length_645_cov_3.434564_g5291_i0.p3 GENE.NODE_6220_length_645_cov_3.434564_g5291_i0~~NODE_6220_length_645_cov_3.434564_g5291_i0.p3  ORF type:complete len:76 (+),score=10.68 NODE_6220_length_645_cov_3.434564_g5291_i0:263-490(+)